VREAVEDVRCSHAVVIVPDATRTAPIPLFFRALAESLRGRVERLTFLIALGTHPVMDPSAVAKLVGMTEAQRRERYPHVEVLNHRWDLPETFVTVGELSEAETHELSEGRLSLTVPIRVNKMLKEADKVIIVGPVFPHEVAGFSGGSKYLFPGVGGSDVINFTHWLGALMTSHATIGVRETAVRKAIELAASRVECNTSAFCLVTSKAGLHGMFWGDVQNAWRQATVLSSEVHIKWCEKPYQRVLSVIPERYDDVWTGAKGMYKVEPVLADGGEVVLLAPHITEFSYTHGKVLDEIGYHVRDYFLGQWDRFKGLPWGVLAHSTHLRGAGTYVGGVEKPRIKVTLASAISLERCEAMNLGYLDPGTIDVDEWADREDEGVLLVPNAGETLYRLNL
jgi:nickel-dependent lactate racemase